MIFKRIVIVIILGLLSGCQQQKPETEQNARLFFMLGEVSINGNPAAVNQALQNHDIIETGVESRAEIILGNGTGVQIRDLSRVEIVHSVEGWDVHAHKGSVLSLVERGRKYRMRGPGAVAAVRGTIFYAHTYEDSSQYICTCNGTVDILYNQDVKTVSTSHHKGYTVSGTGSVKTLDDAGMKEHTDEEIFDFMYRLDQALRGQ